MMTQKKETQIPVGLDTLKSGESGVIAGYQGYSEQQLRLKELGLIRGICVKVKRFAPLGDPMELLVRGYNLSIRKSEARQILVQKELIP